MAIRLVLGLSGGLDSMVLLHSAIARSGWKPDEIKLVSFRYGSKHNQHELAAAEKVRQWMSVPLLNAVTIDLSSVYAASSSSSALLSADNKVPEGHYNDETMRQTVVPGRNLLFISVMAAIAQTEAAAHNTDVRVFIGAHQGDHFIYPDCRPTFLAAVNETVLFSSEGKVSVHAPFLLWDKPKIVEEGLQLNSPFGLTRTCYTDSPVACGKCGSCRERLEAFEKNGRTDFIEYQETK